MDDYDVFLNHRGPDVKGGFVAHLHEALRAAGFNSFLDKKSLVQGRPAFAAIDGALAVAKVHVAVVSRGYAESKYCLRELVAMLGSGNPVIPVFYDVEPTELRRVNVGVFAAAFKKHKSRETRERVQEWGDALRKLADITGFVFHLSNCHGDEAELKQKVVDAVSSLLHVHVALQVECHLVGLEEHVQTCVNKLKMFDGIGLLGLGGMGGIGKTSIAKVIYNHFVGCTTFKAMSFLEIGRNTPTSLEVGSSLLNRLQKQLLWDLLHIPEGNQRQSYEYWFCTLSSLGPVLIVLDDVQDKGQFDKLILEKSHLAPGSCIIVTSRDQHVLKLIGGKSNFHLHEVTPLGCEDSHKLFNLHAFGVEEAPSNLKALAKDVSDECGGLPLALKVVGSSLFGKTSHEDQKCIWPEAKEALKGDLSIKNALKWSYDCLSEPQKLMFVDIACVFCGWKKHEVMDIWQSCKKCTSCCGNGAPYTSLAHLIDKSLVVVEKYHGHDVLAMHDLLRNMGQSIGEVDGTHFWEDKALKKVDDKNQVDSTRMRAMSLANIRSQNLNVENFAKMPNLHYLILDGCDVRGNLGSISGELRCIRWRRMPLACVPPMQNLSNLVSLDFSESTELASTWVESEVALEGCPNLLRFNLTECTSITALPESIGCLSKLQELNLNDCSNLQKLPYSIGELTSLKTLRMGGCGSLEVLPDSIYALPRLQRLCVEDCTSLSMMQTSIGLLTSLMELDMNLGTKWHALGIGQLHALKDLITWGCTDEAVTTIDGSGTLTNLHQLSTFWFEECPTMTKLPESIGLLTNLDLLSLWSCEKVQELPNSIGQLKVLTQLQLRYCNSLETLPDSLGALTRLEELCIVRCASLTTLPSTIGHLSRLQELHIQGCRALKSLPDSLSQLNELVGLEILECGSSLEGLGLLRALQGLRIWGCTSITQLPGSCLVVVDSNVTSPAWIWDGKKYVWVRRGVKKVQVVEANDCGFLQHVREEKKSGRAILQRVHNLPCCKLGPKVHSLSRVDSISMDNQICSTAAFSRTSRDADASARRLPRFGSAQDSRSNHKKKKLDPMCWKNSQHLSFGRLFVAKDLHNSSTSQQSSEQGQTLRQILSHITAMFISPTSSPPINLDTTPRQCGGHNLRIEEII